MRAFFESPRCAYWTGVIAGFAYGYVWWGMK